MKPLNFVNSFDPYAARLEEAKARRKRCIIISAIATLLLLVLVLGIGIGVSVTRSHQRSESSSNRQGANAGSSNSLLALCNRTAFPPSCISSLSAYPDAPGANPKKLALLGITAAVEEVKRSLALVHNISSELETQTNLVNLTTMDALGDCSDNLLDSLDHLDHSMTELDTLDLKSFRGFSPSMENIHTWLSSALTFHTTCADAIESERQQEKLLPLQARSEYVQEILTNALSFFVAFKALLDKTFPGTPTRRRLLSSPPLGSLPGWITDAQRRHLLQQGGSSEMAPANAIVAKDGSGQFVSIQEAIDAAPLKSRTMHVIYIKQGIYDEAVVVPKAVTNLAFLGDGIDKTIIQGQRSVAGGSTTFGSATLAINGRGFVASHLSVRNLAGPKGRQAVAVRVSGDQAAFYRCSFNGYQDTLYAHSSRHFYRECVVSGTVDFIFGNAAAVFQRCNIQALLPDPGQKIMITAHGRVTDLQNTGFSFHGCRVEGSGRLVAQSHRFPAYLGRPWKDYATTVFMQSDIGGIIYPAGWSEWEGAPLHRYKTVFFGEYLNTGAGAAQSGRVYWSVPSLTMDQAREFTVGKLISGLDWLPYSGVVFANNL